MLNVYKTRHFQNITVKLCPYDYPSLRFHLGHLVYKNHPVHK